MFTETPSGTGVNGRAAIVPISVVVVCFAENLWQPCNKVHCHCMVIEQQSYGICKTNEPCHEKTNVLHMRNKDAGNNSSTF